MTARLFHFRISHYNEKVRWALDYKSWPHVRRALVPGFHIPVVRRLTGQNKVPVLELDGRMFCDSSAILAQIEEQRPDPPLFPDDPEARARALAIEDYYDEQVAPDLRRLFWWTYFDHPADCARMATDGFGPWTRRAWRAVFPVLKPLMKQNMGISKERVTRARERVASFFDRLERDIGASGYHVGDTFTIADLCAAAVMTAVVRPPHFPYPLPQPVPPTFAELRESMAHRDGFKWVSDIYARHRGTSAEVV
ncbi:MAG TPA: glutathione S-transferase family protein [Polyangiaceae bacterium]|jgi:glutathione S-transferase|nr:glutathione S-transferase family protein [Polyangiaceae bacterium]